MRYVGIDPSTKTGLVILGEQGEVLLEREITSDETDELKKYMDLVDQVYMFLNIGDRVLIEGFSYSSKGKAVSVQYGIGWLMRRQLINFDYIEVSPNSLKKFATGTGKAKKDDMILPIYKKWGFENDSDNIRDAYILAQIGRYLDEHEEPTQYQRDVLNKL